MTLRVEAKSIRQLFLAIRLVIVQTQMFQVVFAKFRLSYKVVPQSWLRFLSTSCRWPLPRLIARKGPQHNEKPSHAGKLL